MPPAVTWRLYDEYLFEQATVNGFRVWGRWDRRFGCWNDDGQPVNPIGPLFGHLGLFIQPVGVRDDAWYASRAALTAYWAIVPTSVRLSAAEAGPNQWARLMCEWQRRGGSPNRADCPTSALTRPILTQEPVILQP